MGDENVVSLIRNYDGERKNIIATLKRIWPDLGFLS